MTVNQSIIIDGVSQLEVVGNEKGLIPAFNVYLTNGMATFFNALSYEFEKTLGKGFQKETREILVNCAHVCAYNTFYGIQTSMEWDGLIKPMIENREDIVKASVAVCNALGWTSWQVTKLTPDEAIFRAEKGYEAELYRKEYGKADHPVCYMLCGVASGIMDLAYGEEYPDGMYSFQTEEIDCRAMDSSYCEFVTTRCKK